MRIIAGELRGRQIKGLPGLDTRPTSDKVKGAIFNVLSSKVLDARVLDLFAGTGNLSFEALSRGAREVVLVEKNPVAQRIIRENIDKLGVEKATLLPMDAFTYLKRQNDEKFDLIFLDPPYNQGLVIRALEELAHLSLLTDDGVIVAETGKNEELGEVHPWEVRKTGEYGDTKIWYLQKIIL